MSSIRGVRTSVKEEQGQLFGWGKKGAATCWQHKFFCLSDTSQDRIPTTAAAKLMLEEAGLGEKRVMVPLDADAEAFHSLLLSSYPKLKDGGGFELLRCIPNSRDLEVLAPRIASSPKLLKRSVGNGRVYLRPIQRDLELSVEGMEGEEDFGKVVI